MEKKLVAGLVGKDGRSSAIQAALQQSHRIGAAPLLSAWKSESASAGIAEVLANAKAQKCDFVIVGPEAPLAEGLVDCLAESGIPCVGPTKALARLESSKAFARQLVAKYGIPGNPRFKVFHDMNGVADYIRELGSYVVKPDGLTGGKGVKVSDSHLHSVDEAVEYCREILNSKHEAVLIEEKLDGEEFSFQSFCDGTHVRDMVPVQDHKRAHEGDAGPNTGGMGSYSCEDHLLPFLTTAHLREASAINAAVAQAIKEETKQGYQGILYGGFMATREGVRLIEYNARFGDPEALNVLSVLEDDFGDICHGIVTGQLGRIRFRHQATVCKYIVPQGYPESPVRDAAVDVSHVPRRDDLKEYRAAVEEREGKLYLTGSRAIAYVGIGDNLREAEQIAEAAANAVQGPVFHRRDIGTAELIQRRVDHMRALSSDSAPAIA
jgi:phosphoribosylamine---glycine ligase